MTHDELEKLGPATVKDLVLRYRTGRLHGSYGPARDDAIRWLVWRDMCSDVEVARRFWMLFVLAVIVMLATVVGVWLAWRAS